MSHQQRPAQDMLSLALNTVSAAPLPTVNSISRHPHGRSNILNQNCDDETEQDILGGDMDGEAPSTRPSSYTSGGRRIDGSVIVPKESNIFLTNQIRRYHQQQSHFESVPSSIAQVSSSIPVRRQAISTSSSSSSQKSSTNKYLAAGASNMTVRPSNAIPPVKSLLNHTMTNANNIRFVGSVPVNPSKLLANAPQSSGDRNNSNKNPTVLLDISNRVQTVATASKSIIAPTNPAKRHVQSNAQIKLEEEVSSLLKRKAIHSDAANDDWFDNYGRRMDKLAHREEFLRKESEVQSVMVRAFECTECALVTEEMRSLCQSKHAARVRVVRVSKRFFECTRCHRKSFTLGKSEHAIPDYPCTCGTALWTRCGKRSSDAGDREPLTQQMVLTASDWTSRRDLERIKTSNSSS